MKISQEKYEWFAEYIRSQFTVLKSPPSAKYELLRWKGEKGKPMPICFTNEKGTVTLNCSARKVYEEWSRDQILDTYPQPWYNKGL